MGLRRELFPKKLTRTGLRAIVDKRWGNLTSIAGATLIIRAMKRRARHTMAVERIKPAEGVCIVMLFLAALLVVLWAVFIAVRLVLV